MKKTTLLILTALLISAFSVSAQSKDSIESKYTYCRLMCGAEMVRTGVGVWIDYGRKEIPNEENVHFKSIMEAVNIMAEKGWDLLTAYQVNSLTYYVMRKPRHNDKAPL